MIARGTSIFMEQLKNKQRTKKNVEALSSVKEQRLDVYKDSRRGFWSQEAICLETAVRD